MNNKLAIVFPGQSSQKVGMLSDLAIEFALVKKTFSESSEALGYDLWKLVQEGPIDKLNKTYHAQPAILTASVAIWRIWLQQGGCTPKIMAGHSLGEYSALVCSGGIDLFSAVKLVTIRGMLMQEAMPDGSGAMSVIIGLHNDVVSKLCEITTEKENEIVSPAGFNAPNNVVIAGNITAVNQVNILCKAAGAKHICLLPISVPSHCVLMKPIIGKFKAELESVAIYPPKIPIVNNVDVRIEQDPEAIRNALLRQLYLPVRWSEIIQYFSVIQKVEKLLEIGPGKVLSRLARSMISNIFSISVNNLVSLSDAIQYINYN